MTKILLLTIISIIALGGCSLKSALIKNKIPEINNAIQEQADKAKEMVTSETLDLSNQKLEKVPAYVFAKINITELNLSNNFLTGALPGEIRFLKNLKILRLNNNLMTGIPAEIGQLTNLETLDLANNKLTGLPNELANLKNLKSMNLAGNDYSEQDLDYIRRKLVNTNFIIK